ncbi:FecR family protein [Thalassospira alkalitolerans]|uniref:Iron dicitrate transport regulator FecR n=1 Tax=Thalassospira alkalitolerans TaxID=1293890 RepID=A0A1Y2LFQ7_9PROT|nr:FecR family protein [Thalassospira alkalitolerans]OSQ49564.1 hypothetical protein TALK_04310 [Thalassospira alkalitolerans]
MATDLGDQAIEWLVMLQSGDATARDRAGFADWCAQSPDHARAVAEARSLLAGIDETKIAQQWRDNRDIGAAVGAMASPAPAPITGHRKSFPKSRPKSHMRRAGKAAIWAATVCILMVAILGGVEAIGPIARWTADYSTATGQQRTVVLGDGSMAHMNTASAFSVDFSGPRREIHLEAGEVIFDVAKDASHPFVVSANGGEARAVGTIYGVRLDGDVTDVTVREGIVDVSNGDHETRRITVGQQARYRGDGKVEYIENADLAAYGSWQRGKLIFNQRRLGDVIGEVARYQRGQIVIAREALRDLKVTGVFAIDDLNALLASIEQTTSARVTHLPLLAVIY